MSQSLTCCSCGCSSTKHFDCHIQHDDQGVPRAFAVWGNLISLEGEGTPDMMVMGMLFMATGYWKKKKRKWRKHGDECASIAMYLASHMRPWLSSDVLDLVGVLDPRETPHVC